MALIYALISAASFTINSVILRLYTKGEKDVKALSATYGFVSVIFCLVVAVFEGGFKNDGNPNSLLILGAIIGWSIFSYLIIWINSRMEASTNALLGQTATVFSFLIGIIFFAGSASWAKTLGVALIVLGNGLLFIGKTKIKIDNIFWTRIALSLVLGFTYLFDNIASIHFSFGFYGSIVYFFPALLIVLFWKIRLRDLIDLYKNKGLEIFLVSLTGFIGYFFLVKSYEFNNISVIIPIISSQGILTVIASGILLNERQSLLKKVLLSFVVFTGVILVGLAQ